MAKLGLSPGGCEPIQGTHNGVPEDHATKLFVRSPPYHRQLSLLRHGPGVTLRLIGGRDSLAEASSAPSFVLHSPRGSLCGIVNSAGE